MSEPTSKLNNLSSETVTKLVSIIVAIVVFAVVLVPIINGLADGNGDGGSGDGGDSGSPNTFNTTLKDLYGEEYPWASVSGGYLAEVTGNYDEELLVNNSDFSLMPWDTNTANADKYFTGPFWSSEIVNGNKEYSLDVLALNESLSSSEQVLIECFRHIYPEYNSEDEYQPKIPIYCMFLNISVLASEEDTNPRQISSNFSSPFVIQYKEVGEDTYAPQYHIAQLDEGYIDDPSNVDTLKLVFFKNTSGGLANVKVVISGEQYGEDISYYHVPTIFFLGTDADGYIPMILQENKVNLPMEDVSHYMPISEEFAYIDSNGHRVLQIIDVADTLVKEKVYDMNADAYLTEPLYAFPGQLSEEDEVIGYTSNTPGKLDIKEIGSVWFESSEVGYGIEFEEEQYAKQDIESINRNTLIVLSSNESSSGGDDSGSGSSSDSAGISGTAGTILKIIPVLVGVGVILAIVALFYDPRNLIKKD